jgi:predicted enzyme related to lactoylglutathione lyase
MSKNSICHLEIQAKDAKKTAGYYKELFGWKLNQDMGDEYILFQPENGPGGGISKNENFTPGTGVVLYVEVDDIESYLKKAGDLGGKKVAPKTEIPNHGWYGQFADPDGNIVGLFTGKNGN